MHHPAQNQLQFASLKTIITHLPQILEILSKDLTIHQLFSCFVQKLHGHSNLAFFQHGDTFTKV